MCSTRGLHQHERRSLPVAQLSLDLGLHHDLEPANVGGGEALRLVCRAAHARGGDVDRDDGLGREGGGETHRKVFDDGPVDIGPALNRLRREEPREGARGRDGVGHAGIEQSGQSPHDLHAGQQVGRIDEQAAWRGRGR